MSLMFKTPEAVEAAARPYILAGFCGVNILQQFNTIDNPDQLYTLKNLSGAGLKNLKTDKLNWGHGGCGWLAVGYIKNSSNVETKASERVYGILEKRFPIVFESEWRLNKNTNNQFKFVIYDMTKEYK